MYNFWKYVFYSRDLLFSETDFCLPSSSVVRLAPFLKSLVVCCPMRTLHCQWEGAALWVPKWCCPQWRHSLIRDRGGTRGYRIQGESEVLPTQGPWDFLSWAQRNKKTNKIAICLLDLGNYFGSKKGNPQDVFQLKNLELLFRPVASHLFSPHPNVC